MNKHYKNLVEIAGKNVFTKITNLNFEEIPISEYNKNYLLKYIKNYSFYFSLYKQLLLKALVKLSEPINKSTFVDYGGGSGLLSFLAVELGFKKVVYIDIYSDSVNDVQILSEKINLKINLIIQGDIEKLADELKTNNLKPNLICSFDVIEHIYNLNNWFSSLKKIEANFSLFFMTSANSKNPYIVNKLKKIHTKAEYFGVEKTTSWKKTDFSSAFFDERKKIIKNNFQNLEEAKIVYLAKKTRGLKIDEILKTSRYYLNNNILNYTINHPTNTCDPYTGNWTERLIDLANLKNTITKNNFTVKFTSSFYSYTNNIFLNIIKYFLNKLIAILGSENLFFSPTYTVELQNKL